MQPLAHLYAAVGDQNCAVCVDVHQRPCLVQELGGEGDAKLGGDDCNGTLAPAVGLIELLAGLLPLWQLSVLGHLVPAGLHLQRGRQCQGITDRWS